MAWKFLHALPRSSVGTARGRAMSRRAARGRRKAAAAAGGAGKAVTLERAARLYRLVGFLADGARTRKAILQRLGIDIRTFYRDLELLRACRVSVALAGRKYLLETASARARLALPFPDPGLTLGEAQVLAKGKDKVHQKLRGLLRAIVR
jgi:hypothetical protein